MQKTSRKFSAGSNSHYPFLKSTVYTWGDFGKITLPDALGLNHWIVLAVLVALYLLILRFLEKKGL